MAKQLTEEMVRNSNVYIALKLKASLAKNLANECIEKIEIPYKDEMLPPIYKENQEKRMLVGRKKPGLRISIMTNGEGAES